jgi:hypothetical protein
MLNQGYANMAQLEPNTVAHLAASMTTAEGEELQKAHEIDARSLLFFFRVGHERDRFFHGFRQFSTAFLCLLQSVACVKQHLYLPVAFACFFQVLEITNPTEKLRQRWGR